VYPQCYNSVTTVHCQQSSATMNNSEQPFNNQTQLKTIQIYLNQVASATKTEVTSVQECLNLLQSGNMVNHLTCVASFSSRIPLKTLNTKNYVQKKTCRPPRMHLFELLQQSTKTISIFIFSWQNRAVSPTTQNAVSSRSHAFLTFFIERTTQEVSICSSICCLHFFIC
jgi:hypothetical protein